MIGMDYQDARKTFRNLSRQLANYIRDEGLKSMVLGVSGGIDSALVAAIANRVAYISNGDILVYGRSISIESNTPEEEDRARQIGNSFCHEFKELNLTKLFWQIIEEKTKDDPSIMDDTKQAKIRRGNIKARMRMIELYDIAQANKGLVLSTDNYTEFLLGFWTLHGDVGDFGPLQELWKTEVYQIAEGIANTFTEAEGVFTKKQIEAIQSCIEANPTDGLGIGDGDLSQILGENCPAAHREGYALVDTVLRDYLVNGNTFACKKVIQRHTATHYKRNNPINIIRRIALHDTNIK